MLQIESEQDEDGRWIAEVPALPGVLAYGRQRLTPVPESKPLPCGSLPTVLKMANHCPARSMTSSKRHE